MSKKKVMPLEASQSEPTPTFIVGIGASAGGVEALTQFFEQVPADSGMAYVVILHLSPDYDSQLAQILQGVSSIPVMQVTKLVRVEPNRVYVVPPDKQLQMNEGSIVVRSNARLEERRAPVDMFLRTLAESHGPLAIAIILSGTGANGSMGLKRVKEKGGAVFVQNPREALYNEMIRHAIATDLVDDILPVAQIPGRLLTYRQGLGAVSIPEDAPQRPEDQQQALREVFTQLRMRTGHDFSNYKRSTLLRRLERRISIHNLNSLPDYAAYLREHPEETQALLKDLLISVTNFFRDGQAFRYLEQQVMPGLTRRGKETLRIWVAGCATGEEAYTLAMLCAEQTLGMIDAPKVQIFATDIDDDAIATAREGLYTLNDAADVSAERLSQFFTKEGEEYRVRREIREMILFANQNVLKDPPFSKLDLVTCRNLLIYFNTVAQERVMETFHFALNPGGYLLLGLSETVDGSGDLYATVSREHHLYQSRQVASRPYPVPESIPLLPQLRKRSPEPAQDMEIRSMPRPSFGDLHQQLLEQYAPPSIIVNGDYDILHFTPLAGQYLHFSGGELSKNLLKLIRPELRLELRTALYQASQQQTNVEVRNLTIRLEDKPETLTLHIRPVLGEGNPAHGFILVLFELVNGGSSDSTPVLASVEPMARQLEDELIRVKAQLRSANEHHEMQAEELKASNEELQAMNEELRSAAEELETSKEELQSINEELTTVNQELKVKVEEASLVSNNLQNLINSTDIATLFLDRSLRVNLFTPATRQIFNLIQSDFGRPLTDITNRLAYKDLQADAETVLSKLQPVEREVSTTDGRVFIMRILPYRTAEDRINGLVLTFVDITDRKATEVALRESEEKYRRLFDSIDEAFCTIEVLFDGQEKAVDYRFLETNPAFLRQTGLKNVIGQRALDFVPELETFWFDTYGHVAKTGEAIRFEHQVAPMNRYFDVFAFRIGEPGENHVAVIFNDISNRKRREANLAFLAEVSQDLVRLTDIDEMMNMLGAKIGGHFQVPDVIFSEVSEDLQWVYVNHEWHSADFPSVKGAYEIKAYFSPEFEQLHRTGQNAIVRDTAQDERVDTASYAALGIGSLVNIPLVRDGEWRFNLTLNDRLPRDWHDAEIALMRDLTDRIWTRLERIRTEAALRESEQRLASIKPLTLLAQTEDLAQVGSWEYHPATSQFIWSAGMYRLFELPPDTPIQPDIYLDFVVDEDKSQAQQVVAYLHEGEGHLESLLRIRVGDQNKTLRIKADVIGEAEHKRVLGVDLDITEQLKAQTQIRETAENLQAVLNSSPASIALLKAVHDEQHPEHILDFRLAVGNNKLAQFFGQPLSELLNQSVSDGPFRELLWEGETLDNLRQVYQSHQSRYDEKPLAPPNQDRWLAISVMRQDDGVVLTGLDITELKQVQAQQQQWLSELESSRHSVDALAALKVSLNQRTELLRTFSHDLRGNFGVIQGALHLLGMADTENDRAQMMAMVLRNVNQATSLLTDLLDLARLESGQQSRSVVSFDASALLQELGQSLQPVAQEHGLALRLLGPDTLSVENDRQLVYRMAQNLLINALKYTSQGHVAIHWSYSEDCWWFEVVDTGPGLAPELVESLNTAAFIEPSNSAETKSANNWIQMRGEGIGLRTVRELATLLDAQLQVSSEVGVGTRFQVNFPRHPGRK